MGDPEQPLANDSFQKVKRARRTFANESRTAKYPDRLSYLRDESIYELLGASEAA